MTHPPLLSTLKEFRLSLPGKARLYVGGCSGEPLAVADAFRQVPQLAAGVTFLGIWIPGVNQTDWANLHEDARAESIFLSPALRGSFEAGKTDFLPLSYTQSWTWLETTPLHGAIIMVSPPDAGNRVSLGVSSDFAGAVLERQDVRCMAVINPHLKTPQDAPHVPLSRFTHVAEDDTPLVQVPPKSLPPAFASIGRHIASLIDDGDTLQFGLGNVQQAVLEALRDRRDLRIHAGMISDPILGLLDAGAIADYPSAITTGVAIGTDTLYARAAHDRRIRFQPVSYTHSITTLAAIPKLKAINSCIEIDLFGQVNAEFIGGRQVSGTGGLVDFLRGAAASPQGRGIIALTSTAKGGSISRIVPRLAPDATSITRADIDTVVTEHGIASLAHKSLDQRAKSLISIADPAHRDHLASDWAAIRKAM